MKNRLQKETSPYLRQHAENPVDWYPWCGEAFERAKQEDKPVFLSVGYSTCHWCHVMAHESFEDEEIAEILNRHFISIKVDKEERPDIDSIYMNVCQAFTGSGGWPMSIFMTPDQKPFFAGTYFPKRARHGMIGMRELLSVIHEKWVSRRADLIAQAEDIVDQLANSDAAEEADGEQLPDAAAELYRRAYDRKHGGFGDAPKFPTPHNLMFLMEYYRRCGDESCLEMAEHTLMQMYRGGLFDHIGFGFSRYSTDERFLVPHFEKMLYDNALLILAFCKAHTVAGDAARAGLYLQTARRTAEYVLREMTSPDGGFYSAQDADSEGEEGRYYVFTPEEIGEVLGQPDAEAFCRHFGISVSGNFEGRSIPNLLNSDPYERSFDGFLPKLLRYRKDRHSLHLDDKILTAWNGLMIAAMCALYRVSRNEEYLRAAQNADRFIRDNLYESDSLFVSFASGRRGARGFLDDYAAYCYAQLALYAATLEQEYLDAAERLCRKVLADFADDDNGGFYFSGSDGEKLILRPKETYDAAMPSGNSLMAWNLVHLWHLTGDEEYRRLAERQLDFLAKQAGRYPMGYGMFLTAQLQYDDPPMKVTVVLADEEDKADLPLRIPDYEAAIILQPQTAEYPLKDGKTTYYVCDKRKCYPPTNHLGEYRVGSDAKPD